jgi:hypothetical protein
MLEIAGNRVLLADWFGGFASSRCRFDPDLPLNRSIIQHRLMRPVEAKSGMVQMAGLLGNTGGGGV